MRLRSDAKLGFFNAPDPSTPRPYVKESLVGARLAWRRFQGTDIKRKRRGKGGNVQVCSSGVRSFGSFLLPQYNNKTCGSGGCDIPELNAMETPCCVHVCRKEKGEKG